MRIAFYAPLKAPTHGTPSGDRRVAGLLMQALGLAGARVELVSTFRSYDRTGDPARQAALRRQGEALGENLAKGWLAQPAAQRPQLWFTYHIYYKAPDWLGPLVAARLGIPYVLAEASFARKRAGGPWAIGHDATERAIRAAAAVFCPSRDDVPGIEALVPRERLVLLPPFLDVTPYTSAAAKRPEHRAKLSAEHGLDDSVPWIVVAAMMRDGDKLASYRELARALALVRDLPWRLLVAGEGAARERVVAALDAGAPGRTTFLGALNERRLAALYAACDVCAWPAVNEAYGMALLEAEASGVPVVSCALRGVPDVVVDGRTGLLAPPGDATAFAACLRTLLADPARRLALGRGAAEFVLAERGLEAAARRLHDTLAGVAG
ncbi:MAG: glycosyltransferase family 4 protein [Betaproteobacteria bacterium]